MKSEMFLQDVTEKIETKIQELKAGLYAGQQEIKNMHDYYWENYAEMDEYGYEIYDNQQALLHQVNANQEKTRLLQRLGKMRKSPYFGRVDFRYEEGRGGGDFLYRDWEFCAQSRNCAIDL